MFGNKKLASLEARHNNLESRFNQALELIEVQKTQIEVQKTQIESQQQTIHQLINSKLDYHKLSLEVVESLDYLPLTEAVQEFVNEYEFDYDEIASNLEDSVAERVANDVDWNDVIETFASDIVGDDYSKLIDLITSQLDLSSTIETEVSEYLSKGDIPFGDYVGEWLENNGDELVANAVDTRAVLDALTNDLDTDEGSSRDLVETLMTAFNSYNDWRSENGYDVISIGSSSSLDLESLGSQIKAFIETHTATSSEDAVGDYTPLEWQVLMVIRKAILEVLS